MKVMQGSGHAHSLCHSALLLSFLNLLTHTYVLRNDDKAPQTCISLSLSLSLSLVSLHTHSHWPRSEHWTTLSWQWQPKGHIGMSGGRISSTAEPSSSSLIIVIIPPLSILSMAKSQKPLCSKGRAEEGESSRATHNNSRREQCGSILITWEDTRKESSVSFIVHECIHLLGTPS